MSLCSSLKKDQPIPTYDDSIDSKDAMYDEFKYICCCNCLNTSKINLHKFCMALPSNLVFSRGFEMDRPMLSD